MSNVIMKKILPGIIIVSFLLSLPLLCGAEGNPDMIQASNWIDREIYGKNGNQFGEIDDLVIKRSGKVKKVTIEVGGFLDIRGDDLRVAVPYEPLGFTAYGIVCDLNRRQISKLPGYSDEN
jgi:sporulation protein YlmC with PRC-barrel domain